MENYNITPISPELDADFKAFLEKYYSLSLEERRPYDRILKSYRDSRNQLLFAKEEGRAESLVNTILRLGEMGINIPLIAQRLKISVDYVRKVLDDHGLPSQDV